MLEIYTIREISDSYIFTRHFCEVEFYAKIYTISKNALPYIVFHPKTGRRKKALYTIWHFKKSYI